MGQAPIAIEKLDLIGIDALCERLAEGISMTQIAKESGVSLNALHRWCSDEEHSARILIARSYAATLWDDKAEQGFIEAEDMFQLTKARDLAHHYRWRASKIAPRVYGDKLGIEHTGNVTLVVDTGVPLRVVHQEPTAIEHAPDTSIEPQSHE